MLALIGEIADGGLPLLYPPESFVDAMAHIAAGAARAGRQLDDIDVAACIWVSVDDDAERARRPMAEKLAYYGASFSPDVLARVGVDATTLAELRNRRPGGERPRRLPPAMMTLGVSGTPDEVVERCRGLIDAGATSRVVRTAARPRPPNGGPPAR